MNARISQRDFANYAAAWATFIASASADEVRALFQPDERQAQFYVSFDLPGTIIPLLSTVDIARVTMRFVLLPAEHTDEPRFGLVLYAADEQGGRISAYYLGTAQWENLHEQLQACQNVLGNPDKPDNLELAGLVPFNLIKIWLCNWRWAVSKQQLGPALFATNYGPLQGYDFELSDFLEPLFQTKDPGITAVRANFGLKRYHPAYSENQELPTSTFGVVLRLYAPGDKLNDAPGGPSYDMSKPVPPH